MGQMQCLGFGFEGACDLDLGAARPQSRDTERCREGICIGAGAAGGQTSSFGPRRPGPGWLQRVRQDSLEVRGQAHQNGGGTA